MTLAVRSKLLSTSWRPVLLALSPAMRLVARPARLVVRPWFRPGTVREQPKRPAFGVPKKKLTPGLLTVLAFWTCFH